MTAIERSSSLQRQTAGRLTGLNLLVAGSTLAMFILILTGWDESFQELFYSPDQHSWYLDKSMAGTRIMLYFLPKVMLITLACLALVKIIWPAVFPVGDRIKALYLLLCLGLVPGTVAALKKETGLYCPGQMEQFGGTKPDISLLQALKSPGLTTPGDGRCFPAGHASGGFALIAFYFMSGNRRWKASALAGAMACGWSMGMYQIMKGDHFLSHTLASMLLATAICGSLAVPFRRYGRLDKEPAVRKH